MPDPVSMYHPQSGRTQRASRGAFDRVWSQEGWALVAEQAQVGDEPTDREPADREPEPEEPDSEADDLDGLGRDELLALAETKGIKVDNRWGKARLAAAIREAE